MMTRAERAKLFAPFDAMKGLQEALRDREERHLRVEKHEISEDDERRAQDEIQKLTDKHIVEMDKYLAEKEKDLMAV